MKKVLFFICFFISLYSFGQKQNIIPNSSFENMAKCPSGSRDYFIDSLDNWFMPTLGTTDYFNTCFNFNSTYRDNSVPNNFQGFQYPHSGAAYIGIIPYSNGFKNYREYISVKLKKKLSRRNIYVLKFFVSLANNSTYAISRADLGLYFSKDSIIKLTSNPFYFNLKLLRGI